MSRSLILRNIVLGNPLNTLKNITSINKVTNRYLKHAFNSRSIHTSNILHYKLFVEAENAHAHDVMKSLAKQYIFVRKDSKVMNVSEEKHKQHVNMEWKNLSTEDVLKSLVILSDYAALNNISITSETYDKFIDVLTDNLQNMSDDQLEVVFHNLKKWPTAHYSHSRNFIEVWTALDNVLCSRAKDLDLPKLLLFADHFYLLKLSKQVGFVKVVTNRLTRRYKNLKPEHLVQAAFLVALCRVAPASMVNLEVRLAECFDQLSLDEISIICMGFFKTKTPIRNAVITDSIMNRVIYEAENISEICLAAILKSVRLSMKNANNETLLTLLDSLQGRKWNLFVCVHLCLLCSTARILHPPTLDMTAQLIVDDPANARLKDLERFTLAMHMLDYSPHTTEPVLKVIVKELRSPNREEEFTRHGDVFFDCLSYLALRGEFPEDLITKVLVDEVVAIPYGVTKAEVSSHKRGCYSLDKTVEAECPSYKGNRLSKKLCRALACRFTDYFPDPNFNYKPKSVEMMSLEVLTLLRKLKGEQYVSGEHILPHYQRGVVVFCNDFNGRPVKVAHHFHKEDFGTVRWAPTSDRWFAIVPGGKNIFIENTGGLLGSFVSHSRQLRKVGYTSTNVFLHEWLALKSDEEKINHLQGILRKLELVEKEYLSKILN